MWKVIIERVYNGFKVDFRGNGGDQSLFGVSRKSRS